MQEKGDDPRWRPTKAACDAESDCQRDRAVLRDPGCRAAGAVDHGSDGRWRPLRRLADVLADEFTLISYDRRGNGRSPIPDGWETTSPEEQADDAAGLLDALGTGPAAVFGTSSGGSLCAVSDGALSGVGARCDSARAGLVCPGRRFRRRSSPVRAVVQKAMAAGGPPAAVERFWCYVAGTTTAGTGYRPRFVSACAPPPARCSGSSLGRTSCSLPGEEALAALAAPVRLLVSEDGLPFSPEIPAAWASAWAWTSPPCRVDTHAYHEYPWEFAEAIRPFLREVSFG